MFSAVPPATRALILINIGVYLLELLLPGPLLQWCALWPYGTPQFHAWQLLSYAFLHDPRSFTHIFFNMFALFMFGGALEHYWSARRLLLFYLVCALSGAVTQLVVEQLTGTAVQVIGASGAVFGVLLAFAWYFPKAQLRVYFVIPMPAWLFVTLYGMAELVFGVTGTQGGVAHFVHLGGMLGGALCILYWRLRRRFARR